MRLFIAFFLLLLSLATQAQEAPDAKPAGIPEPAAKPADKPPVNDEPSPQKPKAGPR